MSASLDQTVRVWDISGLRKKNVAPGLGAASSPVGPSSGAFDDDPGAKYGRTGSSGGKTHRCRAVATGFFVHVHLLVELVELGEESDVCVVFTTELHDVCLVNSCSSLTCLLSFSFVSNFVPSYSRQLQRW